MGQRCVCVRVQLERCVHMHECTYDAQKGYREPRATYCLFDGREAVTCILEVQVVHLSLGLMCRAVAGCAWPELWLCLQVQQQWLMFTERLDDAMLSALRLAVKRSLAELSRAINGDTKTEVLPLFYAALELERSFGTSETVELRPTLQELANMIRSVARELLQVWDADPS